MLKLINSMKTCLNCKELIKKGLLDRKLLYINNEKHLPQHCARIANTDFVLSYGYCSSNITHISDTDYKVILNNIIHDFRCTPKARIKMLDITWKNLTESLTLLDEEHFMLRLGCCLQNNLKIVPKTFMNEVNAAGLELSDKLLKMLLRVVAEDGDVGHVASVISAMKGRNYPADDGVFASLIISHSVKGDFASARKVLDTMRECQVEPGPDTYTALMRSAAMAGDYAALHTYRAQAAHSGVVLSPRHLLRVVATAARSGNHHLIPSLRNCVEGADSDIKELAECLVYSGMATAAYSVLKLLGDLSEDRCQNFLTIMFTAETASSQMISVAKSMVVEQTYGRSLYDVAKWLMEQDKAEAYVEALCVCHHQGLPVRPHFFWPLFMFSLRKNGENGIFQCLEKMKEFDVAPDRETLELAISRITVDDDAVLKRLQSCCGAPLTVLLHPYLNQVMRLGKFDQALQLGNKYKSSLKMDTLESSTASLAAGFRINRDIKRAVMLIKFLGITHISNWLLDVFYGNFHMQSADLITLLEELKLIGCLITAFEERQIVRVLSRSKKPPTEEVTQALHLLLTTEQTALFNPPDSPLEQLECHLRELEGKGMNTRGILRKLVQQYCRHGDAKGARASYKKLLEIGASLSPGILAAMMEVNVRSKQLDDAEAFYRKLTDTYPNFSIDPYKILDYAKLLVISGNYSDAVDLIKRHKQRRISRESFEQWERNCWELLVEVGNSQDTQAVRSMFNTLMINNFCLPTNVVLGPLLRLHLNSNNIKAAVDEYKRCVRDYKKTPLQQEILSAVLLDDGLPLLEEVLTASQEVHGPESTQAVLLSALALKGNTDMVQKIFKESKNSLNNEKMLKQIERMIYLRQIDGLKTLFDAAIETELKDPLLQSILDYYRQSGRADEALEWWQSLEHRGVQLNSEQKSSLASLVSANAKV